MKLLPKKCNFIHIIAKIHLKVYFILSVCSILNRGFNYIYVVDPDLDVSIELSVHEHQMFPIEFLEHLARHFNSVIRTEILYVRTNKFEIRFSKFPGSNKTIVISLFTKLVEAFKTIKDRYLLFQDDHNHVRLKLDEDEDNYIIRLSGSIYIPPGKILNLFSLILWYHIRYKTGQKPNQTENGIKLTEDWKKEEEYMRHEINQSPKQLFVDDEERPCFICGEPAFGLNEWQFKLNRDNRTISMTSRVCKKHRSQLI
jgi:hypothetical protein